MSTIPVDDAETDVLRRLAGAVAQAPSLREAARRLSAGVGAAWGTPAALLSFDGDGWRFEAEHLPPQAAAPPSAAAALVSGALETTDASGQRWTGLVLGRVRDREWVLMLPGSAERWERVTEDGPILEEIEASLNVAARTEDERRRTAVARRLYAFTRRLARGPQGPDLHRLILGTLARQVHAQTGALAIWNAREDALTISASLGYPRELVEDVRIAPDTGIIGRVFAARKPVLERAAPGSRRLRYATDSYLAVPLLASTGDPLAVVALTDRADRRAFQPADLECVRSFAAPAALALAGDRLQTSLDELTRAATIDPVTGLLNRRYFETRIEVELQRARRQHQDLALLMVDIDDFKRVNDIYGHLRGDRILREVADLLRGGVRIFDVCARFGGEEFVIVMPGASAQVAEQVAERIRRRVEARSRLDPVPTTVSIGIAMLGFGDSREDLLRAADSALIAAKRAGKNVVQMDAQSCGRA